jgi:hypothetical protein
VATASTNEAGVTVSAPASPLPWAQGKTWTGHVYSPRDILVVAGHPMDMAFIVKACNNHDALMAALVEVTANQFETSVFGGLHCMFCAQRSDDAHLFECPMVKVEAAIANAEAHS